MKRQSNGKLGILLAAGIGIGCACAYLMMNQDVRRQMARKVKKLSRACREQSAHLRETAGEFLEDRGRDLSDIKQAGLRAYQRVAG